MSTPQPFLFSERIPHGTRATFHGVDVVALRSGPSSKVGCMSCAFYHRDTSQPDHCIDTPCNSIVWLTVPDYVTYRLRS